jgi:hypothetical protein
MAITRTRMPFGGVVTLGLVYIAIVLCLELMKPWLMIAWLHPVHTLFAGLSLWCLKHGIQLMMKVYNRIERAWIKMYDGPLAILSDFKSKMNLISAAKWFFNTALLSKLLFFIITSSGLSGLYQAAWIGLNVMASVSWLLDDTLLMLENEVGLFYEDFFMKLCIFSSALSVTSYGVVPAFAFMQCLYVMPQLKQDYFDSERTVSLDLKP